MSPKPEELKLQNPVESLRQLDEALRAVGLMQRKEEIDMKKLAEQAGTVALAPRGGPGDLPRPKPDTTPGKKSDVSI